MQVLAKSLQSRPEEELPVLEANLALTRRYWSRSKEAMLVAQESLANCLDDIGRHDEALMLRRAIYAGWVALRGVSRKETTRASDYVYWTRRQHWRVTRCCPRLSDLWDPITM